MQQGTRYEKLEKGVILVTTSYLDRHNDYIQKALDFMISGFKSKSKQQDTGQEDLIKSLFEQIGQLTVERDWLKKKSSIFGFRG